MINVCDAIMGSGKTEAAITYMNEHSDRKFVYITPFVDESIRIKDSCPTLHFVLPSDQIPGCYGSKVLHTKELLKQGRNIATTHAAFKSYTKDMADAIKRYKYIIIVDEALSTFDQSVEQESDIEMAERGGYVKCENGIYTPTDNDDYTGGRMAEMFDLFRSHNLVQVVDTRNSEGVMKKFFCWEIAADVMRLFDEAFVLTYLFESSGMRYYLEINKLEYKYIYVNRRGGEFRFSETETYHPEYTTHLREMIHILDDAKLNAIGEERTALSSTWFKENQKTIAQLKLNFINFAKNKRRAPSADVIWSTYKSVNLLKGDTKCGYKSRFVNFNSRATNQYRACTTLAYMVNLFENPMMVRFYRDNGFDFDNEKYALSHMVQWIWRSAIRDGKEVYLYLPSRRMREILCKWMDEVTEAALAAKQDEAQPA